MVLLLKFLYGRNTKSFEFYNQLRPTSVPGQGISDTRMAPKLFCTDCDSCQKCKQINIRTLIILFQSRDKIKEYSKINLYYKS